MLYTACASAGCISKDSYWPKALQGQLILRTTTTYLTLLNSGDCPVSKLSVIGKQRYWSENIFGQRERKSYRSLDVVCLMRWVLEGL